MDSLLANYASSDDEDQEQSPETAEPQPPPSKLTTSSSAASIFSPPKSSLSSVLPPPKSHLPHSNLSKPNSVLRQFEVSDEPKSSSSMFSLPPPKNSLSALLPPPKPHLPDPILSSSKPTYEDEYADFKSQQFDVPDKSKSSSSIFSLLPPPKSQNADPFSLNSLPTSQANSRKVVQLKLPVNPSMLKSRDSDDEDEDDKKEREGRKAAVETASVTSFLSSIPAPRNSSTLGALPSAAGSGRRSIVDADVPTSRSNDSKTRTESEMPPESNWASSEGQWADASFSAPFGEAGSSVEYGGEGDSSGWVQSNASYENYDGYTGYENYSYHGQYDANWGDGSTATEAAQTSLVQMDDSSVKVLRKRGRNDIIPQDIIEVKQDELMKNRPREDQVKLTGIAFGPSYQPVSNKGKPSKLHKRKHQIGTLYFDMRQKEMELAERRSKGLLTKAETHAKYGW